MVEALTAANVMWYTILQYPTLLVTDSWGREGKSSFWHCPNYVSVLCILYVHTSHLHRINISMGSSQRRGEVVAPFVQVHYYSNIDFFFSDGKYFSEYGVLKVPIQNN